MAKEVTLKNYEIVNMLRVSSEPAVSTELEKLSVSEKIRIRKVFVALGKAYDAYESSRLVLLNEYGEKDDEGNLVSTPDDGAIIPVGSDFWELSEQLLNSDSVVAIPQVNYGKVKDLVLPFAFVAAYEKVFVE